MAITIDKGEALSALSLTPLIDVVFLLLIFFLVATQFAEEEREMDVQLPDASQAQPLTASPQKMFVNIDQQGRCVVDRKYLSLDQLLAMLKTAKRNNPTRAAVTIRADKRCDWEHVVAAIDVCRRADVPHTATTQDTETRPPNS